MIAYANTTGGPVTRFKLLGFIAFVVFAAIVYVNQ